MTVRIEPAYVKGVAKYFPRVGLRPNQPHPGKPPYVRRTAGDALSYPSPGARDRYWLSFQQAAFPIGHEDYIVFYNRGELYQLFWSVDGDEHTPIVPEPGAPDPYYVEILSTDTAAQVAAKTLAVLLTILGENEVASLVTVVQGDAWSAAGLPPGPAIVLTVGEMVEPETFGDDYTFPIVTAVFVREGVGLLNHPNRPVESYPLSVPRSPLGADAWDSGWLQRSQRPVYALPGIIGPKRVLLSIGDELPSSTFGDEPRPPL